MDVKASTAYLALERMLLDEGEEPMKLPLTLLEAITNDFSDEREIGRGGFAVVYKGVLRTGTVAVKKLTKTLDMHEKKFNQEVQCLMKVRHKNIVRFLGYCAETQGEMADYEGKFVMADLRSRALCFEFVPKEGLHEYITDASCGLEWKVRYQMIKGICEGLHYLHQKHIVHLDLKPANILLDNNMVPKIADFGLSRCFDEKQSKAVTSKLIGSIGYLAPEFYSGQITFKLDMYSLGVIIIEILTGAKGYSTVENVLQSWKNRLEISVRDTLLQQVRACAEIGLMCIDTNPANRPIMQHIIKKFKELEHADKSDEVGMITSSIAQISEGSDGSKFLKVHPLQLQFPLESDKLMMSCPLNLTNITDDHVAFRLLTMNPKKNFMGRLCGIVPPMSTYTLAVTMWSQLKLPSGSKEVFILESSIDVCRDMEEWAETWQEYTDVYGHVYDHLDSFFSVAKEKDHDVHQVKLTAVFTPVGVRKMTANPIILLTPLEPATSIDVHPEEPWILTTHHDGFVHIRNYHTRELVNSFEVTKTSIVHAAKFIPRKEWFVAGDTDGHLHVYGLDKKLIAVRRTSGNRHTVSLTIHPTKPYVLSMCGHYFDLWNWEENWDRIWNGFYHQYASICDVKLSPEEKLSFVGALDNSELLIWEEGYCDRFKTRQLFVYEGYRPICLNFVTRDDKLYLITGSVDNSAKIWDHHEGSVVEILRHSSAVTSISYDSDLSILITGSNDGTVRLWKWSSTAFKVQSVIDCSLGGVKHIYYLKSSRRIVLIHVGGLAILEIGH